MNLCTGTSSGTKDAESMIWKKKWFSVGKWSHYLVSTSFSAFIFLHTFVGFFSFVYIFFSLLFVLEFYLFFLFSAVSLSFTSLFSFPSFLFQTFKRSKITELACFAFEKIISFFSKRRKESDFSIDLIKKSGKYRGPRQNSVMTVFFILLLSTYPNFCGEV